MTLSLHQQQVFNRIKAFIEQNTEKVFVLKGYAGTGKTTMVSFILEYLSQRRNINTVLLASTGRAAKVLQDKTGHRAGTLHSQIYFFKGVEGIDDDGADPWVTETGQLFLEFGVKASSFEPGKRTLFIVDEASMLTHVRDESINSAKYGTGSILDDFMAHAGDNQVIFIGDPCQLPPVSKNLFSSCLHANFLETHYSIGTVEAELSEIHRQKEGSEIISMASKIRAQIFNPPNTKYPKLPPPRLMQTLLYANEEALLRAYLAQYNLAGWEETIMISDSNKKCQELNVEIRRRLGRNSGLEIGDLLMVAQNSYVTDLVNGDQVIVKSIGEEERRAGFTMILVSLESIHDGRTHETYLIKEFLYTNQSNLPPDDAKKLLMDFDTRMRKRNISRNSELYKSNLHKDSFVNALRAKFGYCITCHKSQGGEWQHVFLHIAKSLYARPPVEVLRWYYTAVTRAQQVLHINDGWWIEQYDFRNR